MFIIKRLIKWGLVTFCLIVIAIAILGTINKDKSGADALKEFIGVTEDGAAGKVIDFADGTAQQGINYVQSGQAQTDFQNVKDGVSQWAVENGYDEKAKEVAGQAGNTIMDWLKNSFNWFIENGQAIK